jgi:16S rRNA (adenine1518-N6/adenine1519-N6)-dimethyltransferase
VFGNLPYRSASIMMADIAESGLRPRSMVFTVQRELAERMGSRPGVKSYSSFSVLCQSCFHVADHGDLQPGSFFPPPEVVSSIVELRPREDAPREGNLRMLTALARGLFSARRKTLRNNLGSLILPPSITAEIMLDTLRNQGVDPGCRAEELSPEAFVRLAHALCAAADRGPTGPSTP